MSDVHIDPVGPSGQTEQKIREICKNYFDLNADCCVDDNAMAAFKNDPHKVLNEKVGMKIPEDVAIVLNTTNKRWPTLYCMTPDGMVAISEESLGVGVYMLDESPELDSRHVELKPFSEVHVSVHEALKTEGVRAVLELPFFDVASDPLVNIKLGDDADIILMSC